MSANEVFEIVALITAGGSGKRMESATRKQYLELNGRKILDVTLEKFLTIKK